MDFTVLTREEEKIVYTPVPASLARFKVPGSRELHAAGEFGSLLFHEQEGTDCSIWYKTYLMKQHTNLNVIPQAPVFQLVFAVNRPMRYQQRSLGKLLLPEGQFNILFTPAIPHQLLFDKNKKYCVYELHFARSYLEKLVPYFSFIPEFLMKAELGLPCLLNPVHAHITPAMMTILHSMLYCEYEGAVKKNYLDALLMKVLLQAVTRLAPAKSQVHEIRLQPYELARLREAWEYLLHNMDQPGTLIDLSHTIGLNDFKLKRGFKQLYGVTIFEFLIQARMEKARQLLQDTDMSVHAVAIAVGYKNISSFTVAYKKKFSLLPSETKSKGTGQGQAPL